MDINKLMEQAQAMQVKMEKAAKEIQEGEYEGSASNGLVKVKIDGNNKIKNISIDPTIINKEDKEMLEDLVMIAVNDATSKLESIRQEKISQSTGGIKLPGM